VITEPFAPYEQNGLLMTCLQNGLVNLTKTKYLYYNYFYQKLATKVTKLHSYLVKICQNKILPTIKFYILSDST